MNIPNSSVFVITDIINESTSNTNRFSFKTKSDGVILVRQLNSGDIFEFFVNSSGDDRPFLIYQIPKSKIMTAYEFVIAIEQAQSQSYSNMTSFNPMTVILLFPPDLKQALWIAEPNVMYCGERKLESNAVPTTKDLNKIDKAISDYEQSNTIIINYLITSIMAFIIKVSQKINKLPGDLEQVELMHQRTRACQIVHEEYGDLQELIEDCQKMNKIELLTKIIDKQQFEIKL